MTMTETIADAIARKHAAQLARYRRRSCEEIKDEIERENVRYAMDTGRAMRQHQVAVDALEAELKRIGG